MERKLRDGWEFFEGVELMLVPGPWQTPGDHSHGVLFGSFLEKQPPIDAVIDSQLQSL